MIVGVLGGGQLGRMLALAGYPLGLRFRFLEPSDQAPTGVLAEQIRCPYDDHAALERFADGLAVATYEFENVPVDAARFLASHVPLYPPVEALEASQDRFFEKDFFRRLGIPTPRYCPVGASDDVVPALAETGYPAVIKTRRMGYDGKGQLLVREPANAAHAWKVLGEHPLLVEEMIAFEREVSVLAVRGRDGHTAFYPLVENHHRGGMLWLSRAPAPACSESLQRLAEDYAQRVLDALNYVGVLAIEFFERQGQLLANEMAPRVHNSGHWTIEGAQTSQFENHLRAGLALPLGDTAAIGRSVMVNLIGTLPDRRAVLGIPGAHLHLYDKAARPGRKLGHVTIRSDDPMALDRSLKQLLSWIESA